MGAHVKSTVAWDRPSLSSLAVLSPLILLGVAATAGVVRGWLRSGTAS